MFVPLNSLKKFQWENYDLILPAVAYSNVGQLVVDLFITHLKPNCVGHFYSPSVLPVVGLDPYSNNSNITTSIKVYVSDEKKLVFVQKRSQVIYGQEEKFVDALIKFIQTFNFKRVVMLSSGTAQYFIPDTANNSTTYPQSNIYWEVESINLRFLCTSAAQSTKTELLAAEWKEYNIGPFTDKEHEHTIPGGGISNLFFNACEEQSIALVLTIISCWEGDNTMQARDYGNSVYKWLLKTEEKCDKELPSSWNKINEIFEHHIHYA